MESDLNIRSIFTSAKIQRNELESSSEPTSSAYQENLQAAISSLEECRKIADRISLFSPNETEDDISSGDLQYLLIDYYLADLILKDSITDRTLVLRRAQEAYERYLGLLDTYSMLNSRDRKLYERFLEGRDEFALISKTDPGARRDTKIARYKQENELKLKLEFLATVPIELQGDDTALRETVLAEIQLCVHHSFHSLDMIGQELKILALMPPTPPSRPEDRAVDCRERNGQRGDDYSDRLDPSLSQLLNRGKAGPILSKDGKPLKPFTLLDSRQTIRDGVFRPDHSLPTVTIDEYLAEEKKRGGIIEGGGEQSGRPAEPDEDNVEKADMETVKAREWDEFTESNPKGSGNTLNRG
ncbi:tapa protein [Usnea florida]